MRLEPDKATFLISFVKNYLLGSEVYESKKCKADSVKHMKVFG